MKRSNLFFLFIFSASLCFCQSGTKKDSLLHSLGAEKVDSLKVRTLLRLCNLIVFTDAKKSLEYGLQAMEISKKISWKRGMASCYAVIGDAYENMGNHHKALETRLKELQLWTELKRKDKMSGALSNIAVSYMYLGDNGKALEYCMECLKLSEESGNIRVTINSQINIASIYMEQERYDKTLEHLFKALKLAEKHQYDNSIGIINANIGQALYRKNEFGHALVFYKKSLELSEKAERERDVIMILSDIAQIFSDISDSAAQAGNMAIKTQDHALALENYLRAFKLAEKRGDEDLVCSTNQYLGSQYLQEKNYAAAEPYLKKSFEMAVKYGLPEEKQKANKYLYELYKATAQWALALKHYEQYIAARDSIYTGENRKKIAELEAKYDAKRKEAENKALAQENQVQALTISNDRYVTIGLIALVLLISGAGILVIRQNKLRSNQVAAQFEQKLLRTQMSPHFIFNSLSSIESFIYENQPKEAGVYLSSFSKLMRLILENSASEFITLEKETEITEYYLSLQKLRLDDKLSYTIHIEKNIDPAQVLLPPMLTQPFIENAIEHGFRGSKDQGQLNISYALENNSLQVTVLDNGIGIIKASRQKDLNSQHKSMAIKITLERLALLNKMKKKKLSFAITDLSNENAEATGTKVTFSIPL